MSADTQMTERNAVGFVLATLQQGIAIDPSVCRFGGDRLWARRKKRSQCMTLRSRRAEKDPWHALPADVACTACGRGMALSAGFRCSGPGA